MRFLTARDPDATSGASGEAVHCESTPMNPPVAANPSATRTRRFVVGISGASGAAYALRLIDQLLVVHGHEVHLVVSEYGKRLLAEEAGISSVEFETVVPPRTLADPLVNDIRRRLFVHPNKDVGAVIASGSFLHDGMAVIPCSSSSLGAIATGSGSNLLTRAAAVCLKERRRLIVCHRESPLSLVDIENYRTLALAGAVLCPTNPGFYLHPTSVGDIVDFMVGKVLDLLGVEHTLATRWESRNRGRRADAPGVPAPRM